MYQYKNLIDKETVNEIIDEAVMLFGHGVTDDTGYYILLESYKNGKRVGDIAVDISKTDNKEAKFFSIFIEKDGEEGFENSPYETGFYGTEDLDKSKLRKTLIEIVNNLAKAYQLPLIG